MKKALAFLMSVALLVAPAGCAAEHGQLTLERVEQLAEKGEALTWSDFEGYAYAVSYTHLTLPTTPYV